MQYYAVIIFLFFFQTSTSFKADTIELKEQFEQASALNEEKNYKEAATLANITLQALKKSSSQHIEMEVGLLHILGDCALNRSDYSEAIKFYEQASFVLEKLSPKNDSLLVDNSNKIGNYYREIKDFEKALDYLNKGLERSNRVFSNRNLQIATLYNNIGICLNSMGDFDKALEYHRQALAIRSEQLPNPHPQIAQSYNNIGLCLMDKDDYQEALPAFQSALDIYIRYYGKEHQDIADVHLNIGNIYFTLQDQRLFAEYNRALQIYSRTLDSMHPSIALCYNNLANAYDGQGDFTKASEFYRRALEIMIHHYGETHPDVAMAHFNIGVSQFFSGAKLEAMQAFDRCFQSLNYTDSESSFDKVKDHQTLLRLFRIMGDVEIEAYSESHDLQHLLLALDYYQKIDGLLDYLRIRYEATGSKLRLLDTAHDLYDLAIELSLVLYRLTNKKEYLHEAYKFSEKSKGILLLEAMNKAKAEAFSNIPPEILSEIKEIENTISDLEKRRYLLQKPGFQNEAFLDSLSSLIFEQKQLLSRQISKIGQNYPNYYKLRYETTTIPIEMVQQELLSPNQTIVEYFLGSESLHIFVINKSDFKLVSVNLDAPFFQWLNAFNQSIRNFPNVATNELSQNLEAYTYSAYKLYEYLIKPVEELLKEQLIIIPDGELGFLSFSALLSKYPANYNELKTHHYMIRDHALSYNYSVSLLKEMKERKTKKHLRPYLGLAPSFRDGNAKGLSQLKYNQQEIQQVNKLVGGLGLYNVDATKINFLNRQSAYKIVHLATHGKANSATGDYSFLAFSETEDAKDDEALLYVKEIYNMSSNAEMVILSACETNVGELHKGEGIASIARSFSYAGAQSLITTQWSVDDKSTHDLVQLFFEKIKEGLPKDQAMQAAMLAFLQQSGQGKAHPYFWLRLCLLVIWSKFNCSTKYR
ncbi:MAG: CHAT domain-containing protein [Saprospiraceae bacterium]|nr:CHAT domain-containing protein [Saprospiraceae bacterium]